MENENRPDAFPELNFDHLSQRASEWAKEFPAISRISLYDYTTPVPHPDFRRENAIPLKFYIVFSVKKNASKKERQKLWKATQRYRVLIDENSFTYFIDNSFLSKVYRKAPERYFKLEWRFFAPKTPKEKIPDGVRTDRPPWLLHDEEHQDKKNVIPAREPQKQVESRKAFPCEPNTQWEQVKITLIAHETVRIETPSGKGRYSYHELGLSDKRKGDQPTVLWTLLKTFAREGGCISSERGKYDNTLLGACRSCD